MTNNEKLWRMSILIDDYEDACNWLNDIDKRCDV